MKVGKVILASRPQKHDILYWTKETGIVMLFFVVAPSGLYHAMEAIYGTAFDDWHPVLL
jgi:hypothetical protein